MFLMEKYRPMIEIELRAVLLKGRPPLLGLDKMLAYHLGFADKEGNLKDAATGKYLRSLFCMAICAGLGKDPRSAVPAAASIELAHRTSLIFDDIQDKGKERNNQPTVWAVWGADQAINAGFALSAYAHLALQGSHRVGVSPEIIREAWRVLEKAVLALCEGQFRDISFMERDDITVDDYLGMVQGKTAALFATACKVGAMVAGVSPKRVEIAGDFGENIGIAFQIHDDYLGIWGDEATVGKTANDLIEKKRSLPLVLALEQYPEPVRAFLARENVSDIEANLIKDSMEKSGIMDRVRDMETIYADLALRSLEKLQLDQIVHDDFSDILQFITNREI